VRATGQARSRFFWACLSVATAGDGAATVALMVRIRPAGPIWLAALIAAALVPPFLLAPVAGTLIDRYGARIVLVLALCGQSAVALGMIAATSTADTAMLAAAHGTLTAFVATGLLTFAPSQARAGTARSAYIRYGTAVSLGQIVGPLSASVLGATGAFLAESATSLALALACAATRQSTATHIAAGPSVRRRRRPRRTVLRGRDSVRRTGDPRPYRNRQRSRRRNPLRTTGPHGTLAARLAQH
jgi:MFS family permease